MGIGNSTLCQIIVWVTVLIPVHAGLHQWGEPSKEWLESLRQRCEGAEKEKYYFDEVLRRCCLCSVCTFSGHLSQLACTGEKSCTGRSLDCINEPDFPRFFPLEMTESTKELTTITTARTTPARQNTTLEKILPELRTSTPEMTSLFGRSTRIQDTTEKSSAVIPLQSLVTTIAVVVAVTVVAAAIIYCVVKRCRCFKKNCLQATMTRFKQHFQKPTDNRTDQEEKMIPLSPSMSRQVSLENSKTSESSSLVKEESEDVRIEEGKVIVAPQGENCSPEPEREIHHCRAKAECDEESLVEKSTGDDKNPVSSGYHGMYDQNHVRPDRHSTDRRVDESVSHPPSQREPPGRAPYVFNASNGVINIQNMTVINGSVPATHTMTSAGMQPPDVRPDSFTIHAPSGMPGDANRPTGDPYATQTPTRGTYPMRSDAGGSCVTSKTRVKTLSESAPRQHDEASCRMPSEAISELPRMRRQSSNISSTSSGAVENESADSRFMDGSRYLSEAQVHRDPARIMGRRYMGHDAMPRHEAGRLRHDNFSTAQEYGHSVASRYVPGIESQRQLAIVEPPYPGTARPGRAHVILSTPYEESRSTACEESENTYDIMRPPLH